MNVPGRPWLFTICLALAAPGVASADTFVLAALDSRDPEASMNVTSLMSAELDFQPAVSDVVEILTEPSGSSCLASTSCLGALLREGGGDKLITGTLATSSTVFTLDLVYFDGRSIVRRQTFELEASPMALADGMTGVVRAMLTGKSPTEEAEEDAGPSVADVGFALEDDGFAFEPIDDDATRRAEERRAEERRRREAEEEARRRAEEEARRRAEEEERRRAEEERRLEEERRRRAEAEARREAEATARRRADEEAARREAETAEFDPAMISFASASSDIKVESADEITFARPSDVSVERSSASYSGTPNSYDDDLDLDDLDLDDDRPVRSSRSSSSSYEDLDADRDRGRSRTATPTRGTTRADKPQSEHRHGVNLIARGGYSQYFKLGFITYGGEVAVPLGQIGLYAIGGFEAYSTNRTLPPELAEQLQRNTAWDTIFPFNAGLLYKIHAGNVAVPYAGADAIFAQYYVDEESGASSWAVGARARIGSDFFFTKVFGLTINGSLGFWSGKNWTIIDQGMKNSGLLPQISGGAVFRL